MEFLPHLLKPMVFEAKGGRPILETRVLDLRDVDSPEPDELFDQIHERDLVVDLAALLGDRFAADFTLHLIAGGKPSPAEGRDLVLYGRAASFPELTSRVRRPDAFGPGKLGLRAVLSHDPTAPVAPGRSVADLDGPNPAADLHIGHGVPVEQVAHELGLLAGQGPVQWGGVHDPANVVAKIRLGPEDAA
jgi:hypothetical protein